MTQPKTVGRHVLGEGVEQVTSLSPADVEAGKPAAWMCPAEPYWDGKEWQPCWQVTTDQKLAEYWARPDKPTPLFALPLPNPEVTQ